MKPTTIRGTVDALLEGRTNSSLKKALEGIASDASVERYVKRWESYIAKNDLTNAAAAADWIENALIVAAEEVLWADAGRKGDAPAHIELRDKFKDTLRAELADADEPDEALLNDLIVDFIKRLVKEYA